MIVLTHVLCFLIGFFVCRAMWAYETQESIRIVDEIKEILEKKEEQK